MADLLDHIDWRAVQGLNLQPDKGADNALKQGLRDDAALTTVSDTDAQLLINIPFTQAVRVASITFRAPAGPGAPRRVRLFVDRPSIGFSEAESDPAAQEFELTDADVGEDGAPVALKAARFARVTQLAIFFADNASGDDDEPTVLSSIRLAGEAGDTFNVNEIKKVEAE
jgi:PITH domain